MTREQLENFLYYRKAKISDIIEIYRKNDPLRMLFIISIAGDGNVFVFDDDIEEIVSLDFILNEEYFDSEECTFQIHRLKNYDSDLPNAMRYYNFITEPRYMQDYYIMGDKFDSLDLGNYMDDVVALLHHSIAEDSTYDEYNLEITREGKNKLVIELINN